MAEALNEIKSALYTIKAENFEIVRHVVDNIYVVKYPSTSNHEKIFEFLRSTSKIIDAEFLTPQREEIEPNTIYLVKHFTDTFYRAVVIGKADEDFFRVWFVDIDKYAVVSLSRIRVAEFYKDLQPLHELYDLQIKADRKNPDAEFNRCSGTLETNVVIPQTYDDVPDFNISANWKKTSSPSKADDALKPKVVAHINVKCSSSDDESSDAASPIVEYVSSFSSSSYFPSSSETSSSGSIYDLPLPSELFKNVNASYLTDIESYVKKLNRITNLRRIKGRRIVRRAAKKMPKKADNGSSSDENGGQSEVVQLKRVRRRKRM